MNSRPAGPILEEGIMNWIEACGARPADSLVILGSQTQSDGPPNKALEPTEPRNIKEGIFEWARRLNFDVRRTWRVSSRIVALWNFVAGPSPGFTITPSAQIKAHRVPRRA